SIRRSAVRPAAAFSTDHGSWRGCPSRRKSYLFSDCFSGAELAESMWPELAGSAQRLPMNHPRYYASEPRRRRARGGAVYSEARPLVTTRGPEGWARGSTTMLILVLVLRQKRVQLGR